MVEVGSLEDLVIQFGGTPEGARFVDAWRHARIIVDRVAHAGNGETPQSAANAPAAAPTA